VRGIDPPRRFRVGQDGSIELSHVADVELGPDELITFRAESGSEHDVVRKAWGYYATGSLNRRLPEHGLRPALCANSDGRTTLLLVEPDRYGEFDAYLASEGMSVLAWLDREPCAMCGDFGLEPWHRYDAVPEGETRFDLHGQDYDRELLRCATCGHFVSRTGLDLSALYEGEYMDTTYAGDRLVRTYEKIMGLAPERSDNVARVARIVAELGSSGTALDVGSGLGVFPARMKEAGWEVTALDPDARAVEHAREHIGVDAVQADFVADPLDGLGRFRLVALNKVLEHVPDPVGMLARTREFLEPGGSVYIELPDGEGAAEEGPGREEFFIEHLHVFSMASMSLLAQRAGFAVRRAERLREPSDKYTLVAFLEPAAT
jgi:SAM-dependent methyltransferase